MLATCLRMRRLLQRSRAHQETAENMPFETLIHCCSSISGSFPRRHICQSCAQNASCEVNTKKSTGIQHSNGTFCPTFPKKNKRHVQIMDFPLLLVRWLEGISYGLVPQSKLNMFYVLSTTALLHKKPEFWMLHQLFFGGIQKPATKFFSFESAYYSHLNNLAILYQWINCNHIFFWIVWLLLRTRIFRLDAKFLMLVAFCGNSGEPMDLSRQRMTGFDSRWSSFVHHFAG